MEFYFVEAHINKTRVNMSNLYRTRKEAERLYNEWREEDEYSNVFIVTIWLEEEKNENQR